MIHVKEDIVDLNGILDDFHLADISLDVLILPQPDIFAQKVRKHWDNSIEARCDFKLTVRLTKRSGVYFITLWQKSLYGRTLSEIKGDNSMISYFAKAIAPVIKDVLGDHLDKGNYCICTTPKRRHKIKNFATLISTEIAEIIGIRFYEDVAIAHSRQRINAVFTLNNLPAEQNIIVFDDFVTTGQTLSAMANLLDPLGKNLIFFAGINNIL